MIGAKPVLSATILLAGCAVLTDSQVEQARHFSEASASYSILPGQLAQAYGVLLRNAKLLSISRLELGQRDAAGGVDTERARRAWADIKGAYQLERDFDAAAKKLDAALAMLNSYSALLALLVSDEYSDSLEKSAVHLGQSVDSAAATYAEHGATLSKQGGTIAQAIRTAGGLYVRHRQAAALQGVIAAMDPIVQEVSIEVEHLARQRFKSDFANYEENNLGKEFISVAVSNRRASPALVSAVYADLERTRAGSELAERVAAASVAYREAHSELLAKTRVRDDLHEVLEALDALRKEVRAGQKAADKVEGK